MKNKLILKIILKILACLLLAAGAYFWATGLLDSVFSYRSPLRDTPPAGGNSPRDCHHAPRGLGVGRCTPG